LQGAGHIVAASRTAEETNFNYQYRVLSSPLHDRQSVSDHRCAVVCFFPWQLTIQTDCSEIIRRPSQSASTIVRPITGRQTWFHGLPVYVSTAFALESCTGMMKSLRIPMGIPPRETD